MNLLTIQDLTISYEFPDASLRAVDHVDLSLGEKEFVAIVGESGCGKSTLALSIIGLLPMPPARILGGSLQYKGKNLLALSPKQVRRYRGTEIAMIFQEPLTSLNPVYKVGDQIAEAIMVRDMRMGGLPEALPNNEVMPSAYGLDNQHRGRFRLRRRGRTSTEIKREVVESLRLVRIADADQILDRYPFELSGGMRQRIMIAMALSQKPSLLVADEPTTALDVTTQAQVLKLMKDLMSEVDTTILLITHDLAVASEVADRVVVMYAGEVVEDANVYKLFSEPLHPYTNGLMSCIPTVSKNEAELVPIPGAVPNLFSPPRGCRFVERCPFAMKVCEERHPTLRDSKQNHKVSCFLYEQ